MFFLIYYIIMFCCCTRGKKIKYEPLKTIQIEIHNEEREAKKTKEAKKPKEEKEENALLPPLPKSDTEDEY